MIDMEKEIHRFVMELIYTFMEAWSGILEFFINWILSPQIVSYDYYLFFFAAIVILILLFESG